MRAWRFIAKKALIQGIEICHESADEFASFFIRPRRVAGYQSFRTRATRNSDGKAELALCVTKEAS